MSREGSPIRLPERSDPQLAKSRGEIFAGLELDRSGLQRRGAAMRVVNDIVQGVWHSSLKLQIPFPQYGLVHAWDELSPADSKDRVILASVTHFYDEPSSVNFSPHFLYSAIEHYFSGGKIPMLYPSPRKLAAHEMRHIWQHVIDPERVKQDLVVYANEGLDGWLGTDSELDAISYATSSEFELSQAQIEH